MNRRNYFRMLGSSADPIATQPKRIPAPPEIQAEREEKCLPCPRNTLAPSALGRCKSCISCGQTASLPDLIAARFGVCILKKWMR